MNLDPLSFALSQITYAVANLNKKNYKHSVSEINNLIASHGNEAYTHLFRCLFAYIDLSFDAKNGGKDNHQIQLLVQEIHTLLVKPNLPSVLCSALDNPISNKELIITQQLLTTLSKQLKLNNIEEIAFSLSLLHSSNSETKENASVFAKAKLSNLIQCVSAEEIKNADISILQEVILLDESNVLKEFILKTIGDDRKSFLLNSLRSTDISLDAPLPVTEMSEPFTESSLAKTIREIGYKFTSSLEECKRTLTQFDSRNITSESVARVLGMMANNLGNLKADDSISLNALGGSPFTDGPECNTWKGIVFARTIQEVAPHINFRDVVAKLDYPYFKVSTVDGLKLIVQAITLSIPFPVDLLFRPWENADGQLSIIALCVKYPKVLKIFDHSVKTVQLDVLKTQPDEEVVSVWRCLDIHEVLLKISEQLYPESKELFKYPAQNCPEVLTLALLQVPFWNKLKHDLIQQLFLHFLNNHANSTPVLHYAWNVNMKTQEVLIKCMQDYYIRGEQQDQTLGRLLDVAQDLKALSILLRLQPSTFVIDLACLASRREYLNMGKWLSDKLVEHEGQLVDLCVTFLKQKCPMLLNPMEEPKIKNPILTVEQVLSMVKILQEFCLQRHTISNETKQNVETIYQNANRVFSKIYSPGVPGHSSPKLLPPPAQISSVQNNLISSSLQQPNSHVMKHVPFESTVTSVVGIKGTSGTQHNTTNTTTPSQQLPVNPPYSDDVEEEANSYFQKLYCQSPQDCLSVQALLDKFKKFKVSSDHRDKAVYSCMLRSLFDEYRFFCQYPDKELETTSQLFGGIIKEGLVTYMNLGLALRYVLEALKKPNNAKMYYFGITALEKFKTRLKDYPQYCHHLAALPHFTSLPENLKVYIDCGMRSQSPPTSGAISSVLPHNSTPLETSLSTILPSAQMSTVASHPALPAAAAPTQTISPAVQPSPGLQHVTIQRPVPGQVVGKPSIANTTNIDTLLANQDKFTVPPESVQDKVGFIFNNLSKANMSEKSKELRECVSEEYVPWVAQYLVMKRASIEPNFHSLYDKVISEYNAPNFFDLVVKETFRNIKVLLTSDKGAANFSDRSLLKNLGHWLGLLSIGKNKPILTSDIDLKSLLYEAYHRRSQELLYVVPFVAKVLESCAKSSIFAPPCPWTMGLINALAELHHEPDLKLNLKFEIEVLCKNLKVDISELKPKRYLRNPDRYAKLEFQLSSQVHQMQPPPKDMASAIVAQIQHQPLTPETSASGGMTIQQVHTTVQQPVVTQPTQPCTPQFSYMDINLSTGVMPLITVNENLPLLMQFPQVKNVIKPFIQTAVNELLKPGVERSIKITLMTVEHIIKKDFALEGDETRMRNAAQQMTRNMTAGMALITCREPLLVSLVDKLKSTINTVLQKLPVVNAQYMKDMVEYAVTTISQDAIEACVAFIQKTAVEDALVEIDKRLASEYEVRKQARAEGRMYKDNNMLAYFHERMPEQIRMKIGSHNPQLNVVYEEFGRYIPGFSTTGMPSTPSVSSEIQPNTQPRVANLSGITTDELCSGFKRLLAKMESGIHQMMNVIMQPSLQSHLNMLLEKLVSASMADRDGHAATCSVVAQAVDGLLESHSAQAQNVDLSRLEEFRKIHMMVLQALFDLNPHSQQWTVKQVTRCLIEKRDDTVRSVEVVERLIKAKLVHMQQYDTALGLLINDQGHLHMLPLAITLCQNLLLPMEKTGMATPFLTESELFNTYMALERLVQVGGSPPIFTEGLASLVEKIRLYQNEGSMIERNSNTAPNAMMHSGIMQAREVDDPPGLIEKADALLREWVHMYHQPAAGRDSTKAFSNFVQHMHQQGILKTDDLITRFFRLCTEMSVEMTYKLMSEHGSNHQPLPISVKTKCFQRLDAFVRLIALLVKHSGDEANMVTKVNLLNKVLGIVAGVMMQDHEMRDVSFQQLPYHRIFIMLFMELNSPERILENINYQVLCAFFNVFHVMRPSRAPGFAFAWLELISHRVFIGRMLAITPNQQGWPMYAQLLIDLFRYMAPFLRNADLKKSTLLLYRGALRVLLIMLHDFPELLCDYHYAFCDVVPPNCIQMRNLILSAFPRNMRLPDPFTPNLKIEMLQEINHAPKCQINYAGAIQPSSFKKDLDSYLQNRAPVSFLAEMRSTLQQPSPELGTRYNISLMNALVLYVGQQAIHHIYSRNLSPNMSAIAHSAHMDIFQNLAVALDTEGRYIFLNAMANHLRYPNSHTHYFSSALLYLFAEANTEAIQEQITRVLLERLIVNRPHPWGLLITFIELIKNPSFKFWQHSFVHCAPEIEKLFESVAKSCSQQKPPHNLPSSATPPHQQENNSDSHQIIASA